MRSNDSIEAWVAQACRQPQRAAALIDTLSARAQAENSSAHLHIAVLRTRALRAVARLTEQAHADPAANARRWPLFGVPVAVKDNIEIAGLATSCGSIALARGPAAQDAAIIARLEDNGVILLSKTTLDEAALGASGRNEHFGRCENPRTPAMLSGGSSSGSAAAVAAGHAMLGIGTDTLGSIRIPAAFCGVVGFKPSPGLLPTRGLVPLYAAFDTPGILTGSLTDAALAIGALAIAAPRNDAAAAPAQTLRLSCLADAALLQLESAVAADYRRCRDLLQDSARVQLKPLPAFDFAPPARAALWTVARSFAEQLLHDGARLAPLLKQLGPELAALLERALSLPPARLAQCGPALQAAIDFMRLGLLDADAVLTPTCPVQAVGVMEPVPRSIADFVAVANIVGLPAVAWPQSLGGKRVSSLQLIGHAGADLRLLALACRIETLLEDASSSTA
jgi:aspartyl-tRNA(Asn)/glutamyl-tRNA(Gln) amidotransferase subunit A